MSSFKGSPKASLPVTNWVGRLNHGLGFGVVGFRALGFRLQGLGSFVILAQGFAGSPVFASGGT